MVAILQLGHLVFRPAGPDCDLALLHRGDTKRRHVNLVPILDSPYIPTVSSVSSIQISVSITLDHRSHVCGGPTIKGCPRSTLILHPPRPGILLHPDLFRRKRNMGCEYRRVSRRRWRSEFIRLYPPNSLVCTRHDEYGRVR